MEHALKKGYCQLFYGFGKGKTSILNGMIIRALGYNYKIKYYRFLKNWASGEIPILKDVLKIPIANYFSKIGKFFWEMNDQQKAALKAEIDEGVQDLVADAKSGKYDIIFVDELFSCLDNEQITAEAIINVIKNRHPQTELLFSAHGVDPEMFQYFDLISEVRKEKHYYDTIKLLARKGIEF